MSRLPDLDLVLRDYFADDGLTAPDFVLDEVGRRIGRQAQRQTWRLRGRPFMNTYAKLAAAAAAVLVVGFAGWQLLPGLGPPGGEPTRAPTPVPTLAATPSAPSSTASTEPFQCEEGTGCAGLLTAGTHRTSQFSPAFAYTIPDDYAWMNPIDLPTIVGITTTDRPADLILVWSDVVPAEKTATCLLQALPDAPSDAEGWIAYLDGHPGLDATNVQSLTMGTMPARSIDVRAFGGWTSPCVDDRAEFNVPLLKAPDGAPGDGYGVRIGTEARVYVVDVGEETVVVTVYSYGGDASAFDQAVRLGELVVKYFDFRG